MDGRIIIDAETFNRYNSSEHFPLEPLDSLSFAPNLFQLATLYEANAGCWKDRMYVCKVTSKVNLPRNAYAKTQAGMPNMMYEKRAALLSAQGTFLTFGG